MVVVVAILAIDVVAAELELHLLRQGVKQRVLGVRGQLGKHEVALRLERTPDVLEHTGVEYCERHEVHGVQFPLRIGEVALRVFHLRVFLMLAEHLARVQTGD